MPEEKSVIWKRSHCRSCLKNLKWYHNIPLVSFVALRGKCAFCKQSISFQYPLIELITGLLFCLTFWFFGLTWHWVFYTAFFCLLLVITVIDLYHMIIPDELSLGGLLLGFFSAFITKDISWWDSLLGAALGGGIFLFIAYAYEKLAKQEGLGGGDVKLLGMIGAWLGSKSILFVVIISSALGSVVGLSLMLFQKKKLKTAIPFGPFLALGAVIYFFWSKELSQYFFPAF